MRHLVCFSGTSDFQDSWYQFDRNISVTKAGLIEQILTVQPGLLYNVTVSHAHALILRIIFKMMWMQVVARQPLSSTC